MRLSWTQTEQTALPTPVIASTSKEVVYETPAHRSFPELEEDDDENHDDFAEEDLQAFGRENLGPIVPYFYNILFLDT